MRKRRNDAWNLVILAGVIVAAALLLGMCGVRFSEWDPPPQSFVF